MSSRYRKSPLVEVIAEFQFNPTNEWDLLLPGKIHERIKDSFPKSRQVNVIGGMQFSVDAMGGTNQQIIPQARLQFLTENEKVLLQVGPNLLAINHLQPYEHWETSFLPYLKAGWEAYLAAGGKSNVFRLRLRYINRIRLPIEQEQVNYEDYFEFRPYVNPALPTSHGPFNMAVAYWHNSMQDMLNVSLRSESMNQTEGTFILDLDCLSVKPVSLESENLMQWFDNAHGYIKSTFELCVKDKLRAVFEEIDD